MPPMVDAKPCICFYATMLVLLLYTVIPILCIHVSCIVNVCAGEKGGGGLGNGHLNKNLFLSKTVRCHYIFISNEISIDI